MQNTVVNNIAQLLAHNSVAANTQCSVNVNNLQLQVMCAEELYINTLNFKSTKALCKAINLLQKLNFTQNMFYVCYNTYNNNAKLRATVNKYDCEVD